MNDVPAPIAHARRVLTRPTPLGAKARVFRALRSKERATVKGTLRTATLVFAMLVSASAAAVVTAAIPRWIESLRHSKAASDEPTPARQATAPVAASKTTAPAVAATVPGPDLPSVAAAVPAPPAPPVVAARASAPEAPRQNATEETPESLLAQQVDAYREAVALLDSSPGLAVVRLRAFEDRWPKSPLREEASLRLVQALMSLGREADARVQAKSFLNRYPRSAKRADMLALVGEPADE